MLQLGVTVLLLLYLPTTMATSCGDCKTTYGTHKSAVGSYNTALCAALSDYLTCLETSGKADTECPLVTADAAAIETDYVAASCSTDSKFTATCICQKEFWKTDQSAGGASVCSAAKAYILCLKGKTDVACDTSSTVATLATGVEARITDLGTTDCPVTTACQCEIDAAKADISSDDKACTAYIAQYACVYPLDTAPCDSSSNTAALKTAAASSVTSATSCNFDDTCVCQRAFDAATKTTDAEKCAAHKTELSCLRTAQSSGCDGTTTKSAIATTSESTRAALGESDCPALSATCECEVDAAKGNASSSAKFCTSKKKTKFSFRTASRLFQGNKESVSNGRQFFFRMMQDFESVFDDEDGNDVGPGIHQDSSYSPTDLKWEFCRSRYLCDDVSHRSSSRTPVPVTPS